ncbi:MAG: MbcA/ParS/Xre antitoxin family protein, partial [Pseudomonadota bacterium]
MKVSEARFDYRAAPAAPWPTRDMSASSRLDVEIDDIDHMAALTGAFAILDRWDAPSRLQRTLLGSPPERTFFNWKAGKGRHVPADTLRRIGYLAGIHKALTILYGDEAQRLGWLKRPNRDFGGQTPFERMGAGDITDLAAVRAWL